MAAGAQAGEIGRVVAADASDEGAIVGVVGAGVMEAEGGADVAEVGLEVDEDGIIAGASWVDAALRDGKCVFVAAVEFDDAVAAHIGGNAIG